MRVATFVQVGNQDENSFQEELKKVKKDIRSFYKNFNLTVDSQICSAVFNLSYSKIDKQYLPIQIVNAGSKSNNFEKYVEELLALVVIHLFCKMEF